MAREEEEGDMPPSSAIPLNGYNSQSWTAKARKLKFNLRLMWVQGPRCLDRLSLFSQVYQQGTGWEVEQLKLELASIWDANLTGSGLFHCVTMSVSVYVSFKILLGADTVA